MIDPNAGFFGLYRGNVYSNKDPLNQGRLRLRVPQVLADQITDWAWPVDTSAANFEVPSVGQGIWVAFEGGNPSFPVWVGTFGIDKTGNIPLYVDHLSSTEDIAAVANLIDVQALANGTKELLLTQTLLKIARKVMERNYASLYDTTTQAAVVVNTPQAIRINTVDFASNVSIVDGTKITIANVGTYNLQWSGQFSNTGTAVADVRVWLRYNGVDYPQSASILTVPAKHGQVAGSIIAAWNWLGKSQTSGDYVELWWASESTSVSLTAYPANTGPAVPSVIVTLTECE